MPSEKIPAICVYSNEESATKTPDEGGYVREYRVNIACFEKGLDSVFDVSKPIDEKLDDLLQIVENTFLTKYQTLDKSIYRMNYEGLKIITNQEPDEMIAIGIQTWVARYHEELAS